MANPIRTKQQLNERLELIKEISGDCEAAHVEQDKLLRDVLVGITSGADNPVYLAGRALEVFNIEFSRWYV
ncbi:hypothetical protein P4159_01430 [Bacillus thuringiensis]|uniref:hypothetical protein n=1 Tax=Bacillus thuringiensis TaxID=1428 RepID=UPI000CD95220|nr:hypothetical protein [Bacillus thuringiensis]MEC3599012.1 hypothetical protein [Bacillus thuringiensis]MED1834994.1 hypothetical protein [Bacillus thuringiensis]MED2669351.1 hypothetical protein [Bacillus thuringiensis]MED2695485.1 hypothetical protein [Bacillus thuringiensis]MED2711779.1 hypothetical protein [Bacillus thuringiensis]